jgi:hypothetical protein
MTFYNIIKHNGNSSSSLVVERKRLKSLLVYLYHDRPPPTSTIHTDLACVVS